MERWKILFLNGMEGGNRKKERTKEKQLETQQWVVLPGRGRKGSDNKRGAKDNRTSKDAQGEEDVIHVQKRGDGNEKTGRSGREAANVI